MPMKRHLYPANWEQISFDVRARANWRCEFCGDSNGAVGYRDAQRNFIELWRSVNEVDLQADALTLDGVKLILIVLTVAHLDHTPSNCDLANLKALCQRCHLNYDAKHHAHNAAQTRHRRRIERGQIELV